MAADNCAAPTCFKPGTKRCAGCKTPPAHYCSAECQRNDWKEHKKKCEGAQRFNCWVIRTSPISADADPKLDASYMEPLPLASYGNWGAEMRELRQKIPNFDAHEAGKFYSHNPNVDTWYYYAYGAGNSKAPENEIASRLIGGNQKGDVAVVRSGPTDSNSYPEQFSRTDLVSTAAFYRNNSPSVVFQEREKSRAFRKFRLGPKSRHPDMPQAKPSFYSFRENVFTLAGSDP